ncbi:p-loop containing nucleoside triphosphate hydrolase protein [Venustampulla echinocandica]|uniref:ATP-dependent RNA helicase n=1 Tax=Venustampulla echinocandica TaxID=2656787 RepID=A0A370U3K5_9HELO|nr:p-loop containing nucleoside triphosphate hydrolase protein [Venustampulla echinocandica]RDL42359.1 p-loop containing nucleoside triphosphate hydrolase protein [Venustampulla echinocandica]
MDIFKILSRSTKQPNKASAGKAGSSVKLPSAGTSNNPQLFHDEATAARGKKRKRGGEKTAGNLQNGENEAEEEAPNFFAPKSTAVNTRRRESSVDEKEHNSNAPQVASQLPPTLLDEGECRQILRSHRVKVTVLPPGEKKIKKSKKAKTSKTTSSAKEEYKQLYPQPLTTFDDLRSTYGISGRMAENLAQQGYKIPTEVQMGSLPLLLQPETALGDAAMELGLSESRRNINLLSVAPTGSGKTLAFLIPVVNGIIQRRRQHQDKSEHSLDAIIVAPTKELASQIVNEAKKLSMGTGVKVVGMKKGMNIVDGGDSAENAESSNDSEEEEAEEGLEKSKKRSSQPIAKADILVTTPGLLLSAVSGASKGGRSPLPTVRTLVLDEADVLLDPLFRDQMLGIWDSCSNPELCVTLWSATMGSNIETLAASTIRSRRTQLGLKDDTRIIRLVVGLKDSAIPNITHRLTYAATEPGKLLALRQLLHPSAKTTDATQSLRPPFLVFTQTIPRAVALHSELLYDIPIEAGGSSRIAVLHSDLSDSIRDHIMTRFRNGEIWILITTDILSRGVDFRGINGVVNYDVPNSGAAYIHRVGRTGRAGRDGGVAVTFYTKEDIPYVKNIANIIAASEKQAGKPPSEASMQKWLLDALPTPTKEEKKNLKKYGVEARREGLGRDGKDRGKKAMLISSKSGYERRLEHNRKGAIQGSRNRMQQSQVEADPGEESEWAGIDD